MNKTVIAILEEGLGLCDGESKRIRREDFDEFCGVWSEKEADEFDGLLAEQRRIDPEMWE